MKTLLSFFVLVLLVLSCQNKKKDSYQTGVSIELAQQRSADISDLKYHLEMEIPDSLNQAVKSKAILQFIKKDAKSPLVLDFTSDNVERVLVNGQKVFFALENEHIIIPSKYIIAGENKVEINFEMGEGALNRNEKYLYSLFVPDRARTAIPCFDQPDIKGMVSYSITMPQSWSAITNGVADFLEEVAGGLKHVTFTRSKPISTYLWAFAAGEFSKTTREKGGRPVSIYHMEKDSAKVERCKESIFSQVFHSIKWLEDYTNVAYPFKKYDLVCIPSFQFGGMEHPGAVYYRQELLFLDENPTQDDLLSRAQLIAHETAHMWFGDLVTMKWFSGVWQKEVFANFIADKIVKEQFPEVNHGLTFMINHFPTSFSVDRTAAANPIQQQLNNLKDAGSMYGTIIYHKAPIVMNQLEKLVGEEALQQGLGMYLKQYGYGNSSWADLMKVLNDVSEYDLELWSQVWVNEPNRPVMEFTEEQGRFFIQQSSEYGDTAKVWAQRFNYIGINKNEMLLYPVEVLSSKTMLDENKPEFVLPSADASGYGLFLFDPASLVYAMNNIFLWDDELLKGSTLIHLYENLLVGKVDSKKYFKMLLRFIKEEENEQLLSLACGQLQTLYWRFVDAGFRNDIAEDLEEVYIEKMDDDLSLSINKMMVQEWSSKVSTSKGLKKLKQVVVRKKKMAGVALSDRDLSYMVFSLAMKDQELDDAFVLDVAKGIEDDDVRGMMEYVSPIFSKDPSRVDAFVDGLAMLENRKKENWVLTAIGYIHHPYHQEHNMKYLKETLDLTEEIKETGSLFFPMFWVQEALSGYSSVEALKVVDYFFKDNPMYPEDLKMKILQAVDMVDRSSKLKKQEVVINDQ
ncbi:M1 family aminopeptidase [Plebeiibacterium marinum]|uniref:Aminopeptidase N n=1 Tax=Plebeiibacterium marinum TaxID=2992111 RepID=A0AAE3MGP5_9BACT|nr:M1 family aminopeptidase [Plebeiobacterium marinum]MCW3807663.1 M1 family aminopeptidase [Plebeiobacterium marinum]